MASHDDQLWNEVNGILKVRPGWSVQESPTPGVGPYWAFMSQGRVDRSIFIDGAAVHLYEEDADREVAVRHHTGVGGLARCEPHSWTCTYDAQI